MKKNIILVVLLLVFSLSLQAYNNKINQSILQYNQLKNENYLKMLSQKRDSAVDKRNSRDILRKYQELRLSRR